MKKILLVFDGSHFSEGAIAFARQLHNFSPVYLAGIFLPQINYSALWSYSGGGKADDLFVPLVEDEDATAVKENIRRFEDYCTTNDIGFSVHKDFMDFALPQLKQESRFADLLIISSERFYEQAGKEAPNVYLKDVLHDVECPVIVVPEKFTFPDVNILTYDGKQESVYAIKQFAYLFPEFTSYETMLVSAVPKEKKSFPQEDNIEELVSRHYSKMKLVRLDAHPKNEFAAWLEDKSQAIVVCGAYSKSFISGLFHKSFIADVIKQHRLPVFIAHA